MNQRLAQSILIVCVASGLIQPPLLAQTPVSGQAFQQSGESPVKVFILAGQSNREGQAVADLGGSAAGKDRSEPRLGQDPRYLLALVTLDFDGTVFDGAAGAAGLLHLTGQGFFFGQTDPNKVRDHRDRLAAATGFLP